MPHLARFAAATATLALLAVPRLAAAACTHACTAHLVGPACENAERIVDGDTEVELVAACTATCTDTGAVTSGVADPTTVPILDASGNPTGRLVETARTCGGAKVYRWRAPVTGGSHFLGTRQLDVRARPFVPDPLLLARTPVEPVHVPPPPRDWEDVRFGLELGAGPSAVLVSQREGDSLVGVGAELVVGLHDVRDPIASEHGEKFSWPEIQGLRWCASFGCGLPLLLLFAPPDSLLGNDRGVDLHVEVLSYPGTEATRSSPALRIGVQPRLRYTKGVARTGTLAGLPLPELAWQTGGGVSDALAFAWSAYPVDFLVDRRHFVVALEPLRAGFRIPFDGTPVAGEMRTTISFRWVR